MRRYLPALALMGILAAQTIDDTTKLGIVKAKADMLEAANEQRAAMMAYTLAENRYEVAKRAYDLAASLADGKCAPKRFDVKSLECK